MSLLFVKRLVGSELILFKSLFERRTELGLSESTQQKAISPTTELMRQRFPKLPRNWSGRIDLNVFGPGMRGREPFEDRQLSRQGKSDNWRIEGDCDDRPLGSPYAVMEVGDFAVMEFHGERKPTAVDMFLVSRKVAADRRLFRALERLRRDLATGRKAGYGILPEELLAELEPEGVAADHPLVRRLVDDAGDRLEKAAAGGDPRAQGHLAKAGRRMTKEEFDALRTSWEENGRKGEELVDGWLASQKKAGTIRDYDWVSEREPGSPFDFTVLPARGNERRLEVKSTSGPFGGDFGLSSRELAVGAEAETPYDLARVYGVDSDAPAVRVAKGVNARFAELSADVRMPEGMRSASFYVSPRLLKFGKEEDLASFRPKKPKKAKA